jgi:DNA-binding MarR family transcriptional regulator
MADQKLAIYFRFFNEIAIIEQLARSLFEARLPAGFGVPQFAVLNHLVRVKDGQTPLALARAFQVPKTSMTHTLALLERAGFVTMHDNPADGRSKCVFITDPGRAFRQQSIEALGQDFTQMAGDVPEAMVADLLPRLETIRAWLDANRR